MTNLERQVSCGGALYELVTHPKLVPGLMGALAELNGSWVESRVLGKDLSQLVQGGMIGQIEKEGGSKDFLRRRSLLAGEPEPVVAQILAGTAKSAVNLLFASDKPEWDEARSTKAMAVMGRKGLAMVLDAEQVSKGCGSTQTWFAKKVRDGRNVSIEYAKAIAEGVWDNPIWSQAVAKVGKKGNKIEVTAQLDAMEASYQGWKELKPGRESIRSRLITDLLIANTLNAGVTGDDKVLRGVIRELFVRSGNRHEMWTDNLQIAIGLSEYIKFVTENDWKELAPRLAGVSKVGIANQVLEGLTLAYQFEEPGKGKDLLVGIAERTAARMIGDDLTKVDNDWLRRIGENLARLPAGREYAELRQALFELWNDQEDSKHSGFYQAMPLVVAMLNDPRLFLTMVDHLERQGTPKAENAQLQMAMMVVSQGLERKSISREPYMEPMERLARGMLRTIMEEGSNEARRVLLDSFGVTVVKGRYPVEWMWGVMGMPILSEEGYSEEIKDVALRNILETFKRELAIGEGKGGRLEGTENLDWDNFKVFGQLLERISLADHERFVRLVGWLQGQGLPVDFLGEVRKFDRTLN